MPLNNPSDEFLDPIVEAVRCDLLARSQVGLRKYEVGLNRTDLTRKEWLQHMYEELLDAALYAKRAIQEEPNE
jgi:hypothetical protein